MPSPGGWRVNEFTCTCEPPNGSLCASCMHVHG